jgi:hypothetical protein
MVIRQMLHYQQFQDKTNQVASLTVDVEERRRIIIRSLMLLSFSNDLKIFNSNIQIFEEIIHTVIIKIVSVWTNCSFVSSAVGKGTLKYST